MTVKVTEVKRRYRRRFGAVASERDEPEGVLTMEICWIGVICELGVGGLHTQVL